MLKVFKMNEYDCVAAFTKERAIEFYKKDIDSDIEEDEVKELNIDKEGMYEEVNFDEAVFELNKIAHGEKVDNRAVIKFAHGDAGLCKWQTYKEVLKKHEKNNEDMTQPFIISSTEY